MLQTFQKILFRPKAGTYSNPGNCPRCGGTFFFTSIERLYFAKQDLPAPKVCRVCIRQMMAEEASEPTVLKVGNH